MIVLLIARSVTHHGGHEAVHRLAAAAAAELELPVRACFLDGAEPSLHAALDEVPPDDDVLLVGAHLPPDRYLDTWIRRAVAHWCTTRDRRPRIALSAPLSTQPALIRAVVEAAAGPSVPLGGNPGPFRSPAWSQLTTHRRHVLICRGPRCTAYGANEVAAALSGRLAELGLGDDDVLVTATGCLAPCNLGPLVVVHPEDTWYERVDADSAVRITEHHLVRGEPEIAARPSRQ
ncbi:(2Fe-2S) ferredoxin domain-containing protein [Actinoplanes sp. NPDC051859]|uniref:(2Fe-2S) ferredoxin domain-containing protein n=1 Tax=Actinoplanes sp. NPDC051859 TaxID=3363909 RepID=UPI0037B06869